MLKQHVKNVNHLPYLHLFDGDTFFLEIPADPSELEETSTTPVDATQNDIQYAVTKLENLSKGTKSHLAQIAALKDYLD